MTQIAFNPVALVAGGAGFIGSHLCDRLIDDGYKVICIDNLYTGSLHNIEHLMSHPRFTFVNHDVTAPYDMTGLSLIFIDHDHWMREAEEAYALWLKMVRDDAEKEFQMGDVEDQQLRDFLEKVK